MILAPLDGQIPFLESGELGANAMHIHKLNISHVRGFQDVQFDFSRPDGSHAGWTVITGDNGSGKSTLLKCLAIVLAGTDGARALQPSYHRWVKDGAPNSTGSIMLEIGRDDADDTLADSGKAPGPLFPAKVEFRNGGKETILSKAVPPGRPKNYSSPDRTIWSPDSRGYFSCGYGPFRRMFGASPEAVRQMAAASTERFVTMFNEAASLAEVDFWMKGLRHRELESKSPGKIELDILLSVMRHDLLPNQVTIDGVDADGLWLRDRNGVRLAWGEMSDGYRSMLALLADIVRHYFNTFGASDSFARTDESGVVFNRSGVVLIDEIDAHLHPEWQREIGFWLKKHFPKIQFIVTTHSPIICQAADPNGLFHLPEPGSGERPFRLSDEDYARVIRSKSDTILLSPAFGLENTRSPRAVEARERSAQLRAKKRTGMSLSPEEQREAGQLECFVTPEADE